MTMRGEKTVLKQVRDRMFDVGLIDKLYTLRPHHLTVLAYHRVTEWDTPTFDTFRPNVSATPAAFAAQMDFLHQHFNVISLDDLLAALRGTGHLPRHPALITFDDGYRDNYDHAFPVLRQRGLPAVIFLTTGYIGGTRLFWWDIVAYCFFHTRQQEADLPLIGTQQWHDPASRETVMNRLLTALKQVPEDEKVAAVETLPRLMGVTLPPHGSGEMFLTWEHVRELIANGVAMGAHTQSHPIMTRIPLERARAEACGAKTHIEAETGQPVTTLAYTNGLASDFNQELQTVLHQSGFEAAFTLLPGPAHPAQVRREPMAIRRIAISYKDTLSRFAVKLVGRA
jgi:peptidoglycan/xylan/chitin deacetylase (PgdA/CDA1 family)